MITKSCIAFNSGDPSVGIQPDQWELRFNYEMEIEDNKSLEELRSKVKDLFDQYNDHGQVMFDFELERLQQ